MPKTYKIPEFSLSWLTTNYDEHPYGDLFWHLFWGIVIGASIVYSIFTKDFLFLVISFIALFFFFHPIFYENRELKVVINQNGVYINDKKYNWEDIIGFEIFKIGDKFFLYFVPRSIFQVGPVIPIETFAVDIEELRKILNRFLDEYEDAVPVWELIYRNFFK